MTQEDALQCANLALVDAGEAPDTFTVLSVEYRTVADQARHLRAMHAETASWALGTLGEGAVALDLEVTETMIGKCVPHWSVTFFKKATNHKFSIRVLSVDVHEDVTTRVHTIL